MFAVPGWNVSASVRAQTETPKPKDPSKLGKKAQKRKEKQEQQVNTETLGEYWGKSAENKDALPRDPQTTETNGVEVASEPSQEKRGKKRKRGKAGGSRNKTDDGNEGDKATGAALSGKQDAESGAQERSEKILVATDGESKRDKKKRKKEQSSEKAQQTNGSNPAVVSLPGAPVSLLPEPKGLTALQKSMRSKLASARFRHLNESLYTKPSAESLILFKEDPSMFEDYHRGFAQQVEVWPSNPVDGYVNSIIARGSKHPSKDKKKHAKKGRGDDADTDPDAAILPARGDAKLLPRNLKGQCTIADLGCGTASLSYRLQSQLQPLNLTLRSFDLSKPTGPSAPLITVADISALPLPDNSVDIAIFCLALMGTNWLDFIDEAYRVLRWKGELWVSEIKSRFGRVERKKGKPPINSIGSLKKNMDKPPKKKADKPEEEGIVDSGDEVELAERVDGVDAKEGTDVSAFVEVLRKRGFVLDALPERQSDAIDLSNKMFVKLQFFKGAHPSKGKNAREDQRAGAVARPAAFKFGIKGKKFNAIAEDKDTGNDKERLVLKPCLYKIR